MYPIQTVNSIKFQHSAARRRLATVAMIWDVFTGFNTQPPEGGWHGRAVCCHVCRRFQHSAARRRLGRPSNYQAFQAGFNTQPPEGGWDSMFFFIPFKYGFNTQPPEGGWLVFWVLPNPCNIVSTLSRPKAAGCIPSLPICLCESFNTQPPEGGWSSSLRAVSY